MPCVNESPKAFPGLKLPGFVPAIPWVALFDSFAAVRWERRKAVEFLKETKWDGVVSLECYGADDNIRKSVEFLRAVVK